MSETIRQSVQRCARCGRDHQNLILRHLERPIEDRDGSVWTHWMRCPQNGDPILWRVVVTP